MAYRSIDFLPFLTHSHSHQNINSKRYKIRQNQKLDVKPNASRELNSNPKTKRESLADFRWVFAVAFIPSFP